MKPNQPNQGKPFAGKPGAGKPGAGPMQYEVQLVKGGPWLKCKEATEAMGGLRYVLNDGTIGHVRQGMFRKVPAPPKEKVSWDF